MSEVVAGSVVRSVAELDVLPLLSIVLCSDGGVWERHELGWLIISDGVVRSLRLVEVSFEVSETVLGQHQSATVLYVPK